MQLLKPKEGTCPVCAGDHEPAAPHNQQSLYYQCRFNILHGRWPTWADAVAHCAPEIREAWKGKLIELNAWNEPDEGEPLAEDPEDFTSQAVGDV